MRRASALPVLGGMPPRSIIRTPRRMPGARAIATGMRRVSAPVVIALLAAAVVGCGSSSSSSAPAPAGTASSAVNKAVKVSGAFGASPTVVIPKEKAGPSLFTKTVIQGAGQPLTTSESLVGNFVLYDWKGTTGKLVGSTYTSGSPTLFSGQMLPGLEAALIGKKAGSRVLAVIPPADGFGASGNPQIGVGATDTLVFVIDMVTEIGNTDGATGAQVSSGGGKLPTVTVTPGKAPTVKVPAVGPPAKLTVKTLAQGTGDKIAKGDYVIVQYTGVIWKSGKVFDSSWSRSAPFAFNIGAGQVVKGWDNGLVGQSVGSRVLLAIPPAEGYGKAGVSSGTVKIAGTDTLVFVVDILGTYKPTKK
jgi:FKBP-type peptidyl-prolyl cis-trans isomerase